MKAIVNRQYGSPDVLQLIEIEKPVPKDDEVLIRVYASSINSWDWDFLRGKPHIYRLLFGLTKPKYNILGVDVAGTVESIGKNVKRLKQGDEVFGDISGCHWGGFAEYVCANENALALKSKHITFQEAASIPQAAVLALQALHYKGQINKGQTILINGAGGGVGTFAVQIAKSFGAIVTAVDRSNKLTMLKSIGADYVIDYQQEDFTKNNKRYDLIIDVSAYRSISDYKQVLSTNGVYVLIGGDVSRILQTLIMGPWTTLTSKKRICILAHKPNIEDLNFISTLIRDGKLVPVIDKRYPLINTMEAFQHFATGSAFGKIIITMQHDGN